MKIAVCNLSGDPRLSAADVDKMVVAIARQAQEDYPAFWQSGIVLVRNALKAVDIATDEFPILITATPDQADALGYHTANYGRVFTSPIYDNGGSSISSANSVSVTLSHEVLEAIGDPYTNFWAQRDDGDLEPIELCDRVEGDCYDIDGVKVSNFLGPRGFRPGDGPYDWMRLVTTPTEIRPGGYVSLWTPGSGELRNVYGRAFPKWKLAVKDHRNARTKKRREKVQRSAITRPETPGVLGTRVGR